VRQRREKNSELRLKRLAEEAEAEENERGILELFHREQPDEDAPLMRARDEDE
jgi:hypothetical protein